MVNLKGTKIMKRHLLGLTIISAALTGCGGGGDSSSPSAEVKKGVFTDSPVKGLYFETKTQSGLTNEAGEFKYIEGESITFKLGGSVLGVSKAQEVITPFTLTGVKALQKQQEITNAFLSQTPNSYEKAINIATLLQGLDQDGDHENGIDLGNAHEALSNLTIPLLVKASGFTGNLQYTEARSIMQSTHPLSFVNAAENMYDNLGINIESNLISKQTNNANNAFFESIEFEYDEENRISAIKYDRNNDGQAETTQAFTYDQAGRLHTIFNSADNTTQTLGYDANDKLVSRETAVGNTISQNEMFEYQGATLTRFRLDKSANGQDDFSTQYIYDADNNLAGYEIDEDGDNQTDKTVTMSIKNGRINRFTENNQNTNAIDIAYSYDNNGNRIAQNIQTESSSGNFTNAKFFYDNANNLIRYEQDNDLDGKADYVETYKYNQNKQRTQYLRDIDANGKWDFMAQYFYDINGKRIKMIEDSDGNGIVDKKWEADYQAAILDSTWNDIANNL